MLADRNDRQTRRRDPIHALIHHGCRSVKAPASARDLALSRHHVGWNQHGLRDPSLRAALALEREQVSVLVRVRGPAMEAAMAAWANRNDHQTRHRDPTHALPHHGCRQVKAPASARGLALSLHRDGWSRYGFRGLSLREVLAQVQATESELEQESASVLVQATATLADRNDRQTRRHDPTHALTHHGCRPVKALVSARGLALLRHRDGPSRHGFRDPNLREVQAQATELAPVRASAPVRVRGPAMEAAMATWADRNDRQSHCHDPTHALPHLGCRQVTAPASARGPALFLHLGDQSRHGFRDLNLREVQVRATESELAQATAAWARPSHSRDLTRALIRRDLSPAMAQAQALVACRRQCGPSHHGSHGHHRGRHVDPG